MASPRTRPPTHRTRPTTRTLRRLMPSMSPSTRCPRPYAKISNAQRTPTTNALKTCYPQFRKDHDMNANKIKLARAIRFKLDNIERGKEAPNYPPQLLSAITHEIEGMLDAIEVLW